MRQRRVAPRSIAKVNAQSIGGYFGEGTSCFFIRGTILADSAIDGDYPTLNFMREGNIIEIGWFDGSWAAVTIQTRSGSRPGDDVTAKMYLREEDLKSVGVDCTRVVAMKGLPFTFDVEALAAGLFEDDRGARTELLPESAGNVVYLPEQRSAEPPAAAPPAMPQPEPVVLEQAVIAAYKRVEPQAPAPSAFDIANFMELFRSGKLQFGKNPIVDIGVSVAAVATPVLAYLLMEFMKNRTPKSGDDQPT